jgi:hypothetical protein
VAAASGVIVGASVGVGLTGVANGAQALKARLHSRQAASRKARAGMGITSFAEEV